MINSEMKQGDDNFGPPKLKSPSNLFLALMNMYNIPGT